MIITCFPLFLTCIIFITHYITIEMPSQFKHFHLNIWIRMSLLELALQCRPLFLTNSHNMWLFLLPFTCYYCIISCLLWQLFQLLAIYKMLTAEKELRRPIGKALSKPSNVRFVRFYILSLIIASSFTCVQYLISDGNFFSLQANDYFLTWAAPFVCVVIQLTISALIFSLIRNKKKSTSYVDYSAGTTNTGLSSAYSNIPHVDQNQLMKPSLLTNSSDLYWSSAKQLQVQLIQLLLTLLLLISSFYGTLMNFPSMNLQIPSPAIVATASHPLYPNILTKSHLSSEQMQNLQSWLTQLQKSQLQSHSNQGANEYEAGAWPQRFIQAQTIQNKSISNISTLPLLTNQLKTSWLTQIASAVLSLYVFCQFVLLREDVRVALAAGIFGPIFSCCTCTCCFSGPSADTLRRAKVRAMQEQLRNAEVNGPLLSGLDSGQFSGQTSCTITQSISGSSGQGFVGSARGTLIKDENEHNDAAKIQNRHLYYETIDTNNDYDFWSMLHQNSFNSTNNGRVQFLQTSPQMKAATVRHLLAAQNQENMLQLLAGQQLNTLQSETKGKKAFDDVSKLNKLKKKNNFLINFKEFFGRRWFLFIWTM